jgi:hypothetical protein
VAVNLANCAVNHYAFHIGVTGYGVKYSFENIGFDPMSEAFENGVPISKFRRQIAPRCPSPCYPQNGLHEKATVPTRATGVAFLAITMRFHQIPLGIGDDKSVVQHSNLPFGGVNQKLGQMGILNLNKP